MIFKNKLVIGCVVFLSSYNANLDSDSNILTMVHLFFWAVSREVWGIQLHITMKASLLGIICRDVGWISQIVGYKEQLQFLSRGWAKSLRINDIGRFFTVGGKVEVRLNIQTANVFFRSLLRFPQTLSILGTLGKYQWVPFIWGIWYLPLSLERGSEALLVPTDMCTLTKNYLF